VASWVKIRRLGFVDRSFHELEQGMDAERQARTERKQQLIRELAELQVAEMADAGQFDQAPRFGAIERAASELGKELSRAAQERAAREAAAACETQAGCPRCGALCDVTAKRRTVRSIDGPVKLTESVADCQRCRRSFFPSTDSDGIG